MAEAVEPAGPAPAERAPAAPKKPAHRGWPGVGPQLAERLAKIDVFSPADLILHLPLRYEDETRLTMLADVRPGVPAQCEVEVLSCEVTPPPRRQLVARARDASGEVMLRFVHFYPQQQKQLAAGSRLRIFGELRDGFFGAEMIHPRLRPVAAGEPLPESLTPVYPTTAGLAQSALRKLIAGAMRHNGVRDELPEPLRRNLGLPTQPPAVAAMARQPARVPLAYELAYAVTGKRTTWNYHASSRLQWSSDAQGRYRMSFTVSAFLIGSRTQASTGLLTPNGLQPDRLSDDWRGGHVTTFVRPADGAQGAGGHIAFSTGRPDATLMPGAQDEVSVFMQLAALLAAHPGLGQPGSTLPIQVAELRGASVWNFGVLPADTVTVDGKPLQTVHLQRAATPDASRTVDVWYAPWKAGSGETVYLPVRLRISEASGDYVEQLLERMPATAP